MSSVNSADDARRVVSLTRYPPGGTRGAGLARAQGYGFDVAAYVERANDAVAVVVQIEHVRAVENIREILDVPGIDAVFVGPYDLSGSLGKLGRLDDHEVKSAVAAVFAACHRQGMAYGMFAASAEAAAGPIDAGATLLAVGSDALFLGREARRELALVRA